jgi:hypothetical protein
MIKTMVVTLVAMLALVACGETMDKPKIKFQRTGGQGKMHFVYVQKEPQVSKEQYLQVGDFICKEERVCIVMFWDDRTMIPSSLPMTDEQLNAKVAHYNLNKNSGMHRVSICADVGC